MSGKRHLVFIVNPRSGTDRVKAMQDLIEGRLDKEAYTYELQYTRYAKHGTGLAREAAAKGTFAVVAVGGDGSVNDVMHGLLDTGTALAIIPKGSGNGMARTMELPLETEAAIDVINRGRSVKMDIGFAGDRPFISNAGVGFDALISREFAGSKGRGLLNYSWLVTKHLWLYKEWDWRITIDGKTLNERAFLVNVANGKQFGYNFTIAPDASFTDGLLDVTVIRHFPKVMGASLAIRALNGTIGQSPYVQHYKAKEVSIAHPDLKLMQTDGDAHPCGSRIHFRIAPGALLTIVP